MASDIPKILISAPIYDSDDEEKIPSIIVTRDSGEEDISIPESERLYPDSLYNSAVSQEWYSPQL